MQKIFYSRFPWVQTNWSNISHMHHMVIDLQEYNNPMCILTHSPTLTNPALWMSVVLLLKWQIMLLHFISLLPHTVVFETLDNEQCVTTGPAHPFTQMKQCLTKIHKSEKWLAWTMHGVCPLYFTIPHKWIVMECNQANWEPSGWSTVQLGTSEEQILMIYAILAIPKTTSGQWIWTCPGMSEWIIWWPFKRQCFNSRKPRYSCFCFYMLAFELFVSCVC